MSREIKFRVWDNINKVMDPVIYRAGEQFGHPSSSDWVAMQFTGLLDKAGVNIYEGDVVKVHTDIDLSLSFDDDPDGLIAQCITVLIEWHKEVCGFNFKTLKRDKYLDGWTNQTDGQEYEVIGNIYENPELLKP